MHVDYATTEVGPEVDAIVRRLRGTNAAATATQNLHLRYFMYGALVAVILSVTVQMVPVRDGRDVNNRVPPSWNPENDHNYSFRAYMTDVSLWIMLTDLQPHQQCAALISRLGGAAREMGRMITPPEIMQGGMRNGVQLDPVTYLLAALQDRFAALDEETRLSSMTELMAFHRHSGESVNALLSRYEIVRQRAATEGQFVMSVEGCALQILRACNINPHQIILLLHPFGGRMPNNEAEFSQLCTALRRQGHIMEGVPGNVSTLLRGPMREARPGAYVTDQQGDAIAQSPGTQQQTYFGRNQSASDQGDWGSAPWEATAGTIPFTDWTGGGSHWAEPTGHLADTGEVYAADYEEESWASTTTDTSSDSGEEDLQAPDVSQLSEAESTEQIYLRYRRAKRTWRRFTGRPVRKFRRHIKRHA